MITTLTAATTTFLAQNIGDVSPSAPSGETGDKVNMLLSWLMWGCIIVGVGGLMVCGAKLAIDKISGRNGENGAGIIAALVGSIIIGSAAGLINMFAL
ncbi:hypothetical protein AB0362_25260 [Rhodococcus sp. NPDC079359]|mgnify:CR=1 FL=1|jgi:hypothetical protein|uniref:hypothetical protein n=1 Tax=Rhodococcus sp. NPDC079359 TaxID=3154961 RepID=UPI00344FFF4D